MGGTPIVLHQGTIEPRTVHVTDSCPPTMSRVGVWRLEHFELQKQLYKGKASLLYRATCRQSGLPVALKLYRKLRLSPLNWYQVQREIRIHSQLQHENIVQLYAAFEDSDHVYLALQYADGGDLYEELKRHGGHLSEERVARDVIRPCLSALAYLHLKGVLWRDCKPENILLSGPGFGAVKLADFGLSIDSTEERPVTRAGTLDYMAPEVVMCPEKSYPQENKEKALLGYSFSVDAWAIGILGYELIVGHPPFERETRSDTYEQIMYRRPNYPTWLSEDSRMFISAALTKSARKRPTVVELLEHPWILKHCGHVHVPVHAGQNDITSKAHVTALSDSDGRDPADKVLPSPIFNIMVDCNVTSDNTIPSEIQHSVSNEGTESSPEKGPQNIFQWANNSVQRLSSRLLATAAVLQDHVLSNTLQPTGDAVEDHKPGSTGVEPAAARPRSASSEGGSLATLFFPPLPEDQQKEDAIGCPHAAVQPTRLPSPEKLRKIWAAGTDAESAGACSTPTAIKAHHGSQIGKVYGSREDGSAEPAASCTAQGPLQGAQSPWSSPIRRRPHGGSSGSLASTPPQRGSIRFPSHKESRTSFGRATAVLEKQQGSQN